MRLSAQMRKNADQNNFQYGLFWPSAYFLNDVQYLTGS